jgi:hypothetical protein
MVIIVSTTAIAAAWVLLLLQIDPVPTWFYVFAWYPTLVLLDAIGTRLDGRPTMLWRRPMLYVFLWSPVVWFVFEVANFRLQNWYYVLLPQMAWERWCGIVLSFATVVPAVLLAERALDAAGIFRRGRGPSVVVRSGDIVWAVIAGLGMGALSLGHPRLFFPLIWGAVFLLVDPLIFRKDPSLSLIGDLARGYWGRIGRIMLGGLGIGLLWETYNFWARGKWIYTVPWLEEIKLFEMPPFGFVGFPVFALEAWSMYAGLCLLGVAAPVAGIAKLKSRRVAFAALLGVGFSVATLFGMEQRTISSTVPELSEQPGLSPEDAQALKLAGALTPFALAQATPSELVADAVLTSSVALASVQAAQLATLRGIGQRHAKTLYDVGIETVCELSRADPDVLLTAIRHERRGTRPNRAEVRVWIRAAESNCRSG